jgi:cell division septation protein DedD
MRELIRIQIVWMLVFALTASALAQTPVPGSASPSQPPAERQEPKTVEATGQNAAAKPTQSPNTAARNKPPAPAKKESGKAKWIVIGAVAGAAVVVGAIFAARLNNEGYF